jgi:hypothetical protein
VAVGCGVAVASGVGSEVAVGSIIAVGCICATETLEAAVSFIRNTVANAITATITIGKAIFIYLRVKLNHQLQEI